jgi:diguanylate cyclase (GGDEF)-like protein
VFFDIILLAVSLIFIYLYIKNKAEIHELKKKVFEVDQRGRPGHHEEFTLGLKKLNNEFIDKILLDSLTGLPGREAFNDRLLQALNQSRRFQKSFGLILLDIHEFHVINESQGYEIGDKLLVLVAKRLEGAIRQIDTMSRYAGDTFIFLLPQLSMPETAAYVAQRLLDCIVQPFQVDGKDLYITASIGVAIFPADGDDVKTLLTNVSDAMHQAKVCGKGRYQFYRQELHALGERELSIHSLLSSPEYLKRLTIYYQPYMNVVKKEVECIQAIPYLDVPDLGLIPFIEFAKIAENTGKIHEIGEWLFKNAVLQFQKWHKEGFTPEYLSVVVTLRQIENPQFVYKVSQILEELQVYPKQIIFEISGENLLSNTPALEKAFAMLSHTGIQISLSVFSLGHFALQKLTKLPVNYLKINSQMTDGKMHQDNEIIVHMIVSLAKDMKISIVAEGVENVKQQDLLQDLGCEVMQGPLFGQPLPVEAMVKNIN